MHATNTPWSQSHDAPTPSSQTIADAIKEDIGLIWPNNEATSAYVVSYCGDGSWLLTILYIGKDDWSRPIGSLHDVIQTMRDIAPIRQWEQRVVEKSWPPKVYKEVE